MSQSVASEWLRRSASRRVPQPIDFMRLTGVARRTGRFPQLVDSRSSVNRLLLTGSPRFREVALKSGPLLAPAYPVSYAVCGLIHFKTLLSPPSDTRRSTAVVTRVGSGNSGHVFPE